TPQQLIWLLKELNHLRRHHLEARHGDAGGVGEMPSENSAIDSASGILRHAVRIHLHHHELTGGGSGIDQGSRVTPRSTKNRLHTVEAARTGSLIAGREIGPRRERRRADDEPTRRIEGAIDDVDRLEV